MMSDNVRRCPKEGKNILLNFSTYAQELRSLFRNPPAIIEFVNTLLDEIEIYSHESFKDKGAITRQRASAIYNGNEKVPPKIIEASFNPEYEKNTYTFFSDMLANKADEEKIETVLSNLIIEMNASRSIPTENKQFIVEISETEPYTKILAEIFLCSLRYGEYEQDFGRNKQSKKTKISKYTKIDVSIDLERESSDLEMPYVKALYEVYAEKTGNLHDSIDEYPRYKSHFIRQRQSYFDAESVCRASRDAFKNDKPFEELKSEMYNGIVETYSDEFNSGFSRLQSVLSHASEVVFDSSVLCHETAWIVHSVKKGICHYLVNDGKIKSWVYNDE